MRARDAAREAAPRLARAGIEDADIEAELLAREAGGLSRARYLAGGELREQEIIRFHELVARRLQREPAAYILGMREFYGLEFEVTPDALVPRPETELLVELALAPGPSPDFAGVGGTVIVDVGTGTGCVAIAVALQRPDVRVVATDVSRAALAVARRNRERNGARVEFVLGDLATAVGRADIVLANLPYIPSDEVQALEPEVRDFEPLVALDGGPDGMTFIRRLVDDCASRLRPSLLGLEVAYGQAREVEAYVRSKGMVTEVVKDLAGIERVVCGRWE
jgi:release factor glutamine methyltransferase